MPLIPRVRPRMSCMADSFVACRRLLPCDKALLESRLISSNELSKWPGPLRPSGSAAAWDVPEARPAVPAAGGGEPARCGRPGGGVGGPAAVWEARRRSGRPREGAPPAAFGDAPGRQPGDQVEHIFDFAVSWAYGDWPAGIPARPVRRAGSGTTRRVGAPDHARSRRVGGHQARLDDRRRRPVRTAAATPCRGARNGGGCTTGWSRCPGCSASTARGTPCPTRRWRRRGPALDRHYADELGEPFCTAGLCLYRDGRDSVAWHGDRIGRGATEDTVVAIVSLGAPRALAAAAAGRRPGRCATTWATATCW